MGKITAKMVDETIEEVDEYLYYKENTASWKANPYGLFLTFLPDKERTAIKEWVKSNGSWGNGESVTQAIYRILST